MLLQTNGLEAKSNLAQTVHTDFVLDQQGNRYKTVKIGQQTWLAENLRTSAFQDGSPVNTGFIPDDDEQNLSEHGRLYNWQDVVDERNICPEGWRVASDSDWQTLERNIDVPEKDIDTLGWRGDNDIAITLKRQQKDSWFRKFDQSKVNQYQFSASPAGVEIKNWYLTLGAYTEFWTSTNADDKQAYARTLAYAWWNAHRGEIRRATLNKNYMFSVRCVKIKENDD